MSALSAGAVWLSLLALVGLEWALSHNAGWRVVVPYIGVGAAITAALTFMRLGGGPRLAIVFALAGTFWICIMMGLGSVDPFTRHDIPARRSVP